MRKLIALSIVALAVGSGVATSSAQAAMQFLPHKKHLTLEEKVTYFEKSTRHEVKAVTWLSKVRQNMRLKRALFSEDGSIARVDQALRWHRAVYHWHKKLLQQYSAKLIAAQIPHLSAWLCIHSHEGSWTDGGSPYYGGLQMDIGFQSHYGSALLRSKGTANNWTPMEQMLVAERAFRSGRGFYPWPATARMCGLI